MIRSNEHRNPVIYFSHWSRKGYAVFAAMGKEVAVATVPINVCEKALLKSAKKGVVVQEMDYAEENVAREETVCPMAGMGCRMQVGEVCTDANGINDKDECITIRRYALNRRTSFLCGKP